MKTLSRTAIAAVCLFLSLAASAEKKAGNITVLGDASEFSSGALGQGGGAFALDGALGGAAYGISVAGSSELESGFYSRLVSSAAAGYSAANISSYTLSLVQANPAGTTYDVYVSTWAMADPYMVYFTTDATGRPVESLYSNTSYYNFVMANYMEGDYSAFSSTTAVTLAVAPSSGAFTLADAGHNTLDLSFAGFENTPPVPVMNWVPQAPALPAARYGQASAVYGGNVFLTGGFDGVSFSSAVLRGILSVDGSVALWETAGFMPAGLYGHQAVAARGRLYILGGYASNGSRSEVWSADISPAGEIGKWETEKPLPDRAYFHAAALAGTRIYISGGYKSGSGVLAGIYYAEVGDDGTLGTWSSAGTLPNPLYAHSMTLLPGRLLIAGGKDGSSARSEVWSCALDAGAFPGACSAYTSLPAPRYGHTALSAANRLYIIGGNNGSNAQAQVFLTTVPAAGIAHWESGAPLTAPLQFAAGEIVGSRLQLLGGSSGSAASNLVFASVLRGTEYQVQIAADNIFTNGLITSNWASSPEAIFYALQPSSTYYFRAKARNWTGIETAYSPVGSTITYAAIPGTAAWTNIGVDSVTVNWLANGNQPGYNYLVLYSSSPDYNPPGAILNSGTSATIGALLQSTTYYAKIKVNNTYGRASRFIEFPPFRTSFDPALDVDSPTITDAQSDFTDWKGTNTFLCDVNFTDNGASGISKFRLQISTALGDPASVIYPWADAVTGINQPSYTANWAIPQNIWEGMLEGASNYVSVRAYDNSGNYAEQSDLFSVLKDSTPPAISVNFAPPTAWLTDYPGDITGLRFDDTLSGLAKVQYSASTGKLFADGNVIPWTDIPGLTPGDTWYQPAPLPYNFNQLANATSNYFSFRAIDVAGSTRTYADAFGIAKNISGPTVNISTPSLAYLSTFTWVSGNTSETNSHAVKGTEISIRDMSNGLYYNAGDFLSGSRAWQDAEDQASTFTLTFNNLPLISGRMYQVVARSSDSAGDYSQLFATRTFTFDAAPPSARIVYPEDGSSAASATGISGTADDPVSGISSVDVVLRRLSDGKWWKNSQSLWESTGAPEALLAGTTPYWTWNFQNYLRDSLVNGASYYASVRAADASSPVNTGAFYAQGSTFTYYDATPPPASVLTASPGSVSGAVNLRWRAAGDNAANGYLLSGSFKIAYSTYSGADLSTTSAQVTIATATLTAGTTQYKVLSGFNASTTFYFALWTADDAQNWSLASNEAAAMSGAPDTGALTGRVTDASTQPVTGVLVEAIGPSGAVEGNDYTDIFGNYSIPALNSLYLTIRAVWTAQDLESSVSKDGIPNGSTGVNFTLSVTYQLATISGFIPSNFMPRQAASRPAGARYTTREVRPSSGSEPFVEIYSRGRRIGAAFTDSSGAFSVPNLLPGTYGLRVYNGSDFSKMETVTLRPGQNLVFTPKWDLLNKAGVYAYPNPANTAVNFHFTSDATEAEVEIFDIAGRLVKKLANVSDDSAVVPGVNSKKIYWDMSHESIASGVYLYILRVKKSATGETEKVVKKFAVIR
ncbi:MAG: T9SS type A sorting domain-containing protein [Elusimicrobiales bacterium]|nr:T9SS type A sorting domain-containing protein [Elusimicrobiales bacterium]